MNRRTFLRSGPASALLLGAGLTGGSSRTLARAEGTARNVVFLVADGMAMATLTMADELRRILGEAEPLHWSRLRQCPHARSAWMDVRPRDAIVTDSAAAGSAWGCGVPVPVRALNTGPDGEGFLPIGPIFHAAGRAVGLVTTTRLTHATPASFVANADHRNDEDAIATQYLEREVDLLLGGGRAHFEAASRADGRDLLAAFRQAGYVVVHDRRALAATPAGPRVLGTFAADHLPYSLDRAADPALEAAVPTLAEMTRTALERLARHPRGFLLQVEGGRVDHGAHANDAAAMLFDLLAFDEAVGVALDFAGARTDTLVLVTTDHATGNPALNRSRNGYPATRTEFARLAAFRRTLDGVLHDLDANDPAETLRERVEAATGIAIAPAEAERVRQALRGQRDATYRMLAAPEATLGAVMANYTAVGWTGTTHTTDYVPVTAWGPGCELLGGFVRNTALFGLMVTAAGVADCVPATQWAAAAAAP